MNGKKIIKNIFQKKTQYQSFSYFIPTPPTRTTGYREKQFDFIVEKILNGGYQMTHFKTESIDRSEMSGMWVVLILKSTGQVTPLEDILESLERSTSPSAF